MLDVVRGIDPLIWALIFVNVVGLGPFAGVLALTIHNAGDLAKLYSEAIDNIDRREIDGIKAGGGGPVAVIRLGVLPQVLPNLLSQSLYYFESNTRSATIIGAVGAGGIGLLLTERIRHNLWSEVAFLIVMILVAVLVIDLLSKRVREAFIRGRPAPLVSNGAAGYPLGGVPLRQTTT
jgi:phosphonate transport system permease protein